MFPNAYRLGMPHRIGRRRLLSSAAATVTLSAQPAKSQDGHDDWLRQGDLGEAPVRMTDKFPLSDQTNSGGWVPNPAFSDEFDGSVLDPTKWHPTNPGWPGRPPCAFLPKNVRVSDGNLHIDLRREEPPADLRRHGYHGWTSGAVQSRSKALYGYFEVRSKPIRAAVDSAFWFTAKERDQWTEIDVYEIWAGAAGLERTCSTNLHQFQMPSGKPDRAHLGNWIAPFDLADDFHVYGLDWGPTEILFYVDGVLIRRKINTVWHQPLALNLDVEIMADLVGLPNPEDLPSTYSIDYVRGFSKPS